MKPIENANDSQVRIVIDDEEEVMPKAKDEKEVIKNIIKKYNANFSKMDDEEYEDSVNDITLDYMDTINHDLEPYTEAWDKLYRESEAKVKALLPKQSNEKYLQYKLGKMLLPPKK